MTPTPRKDPEAKLIPDGGGADPGDLRLWPAARAPSLATGGMVTKLQAAQIATEPGL